ncbi:hypothetical protein HZS_7272 [Henneguya salminicola]|nr:hypothetical protein HZS_7272 [Henneguya salminicola]
MSAFKSKFTKYYDKILDDQNVNESKNQNLYRKLFMFKVIKIFDDSYKIYFSRGFFEEIKTRIGYQHVNIPFIRCSNGISILNLLKSIAFLPHISAEIIGYDVFESALQKNFLFPCGKPSGLIELVFEYFSALIYSLQSPEISNNMIKTMEFCLDLIENMVTNDILAEYIYQHPPCRVLRSYFYLHPCVVMFLSSQINSRLSLSIYEKYISLVYYIIDDNITTHHVQLDCDWVKLFRGIVFLCSFIARNFGSSNQKEALICLRKSFCLIDIFLTKSDKIILSTRDYDSMLYELVRNSFELQNIFDMSF